VGGDDGSPGVAVVTTAALTFLLSGIYSGALAPEHLADLRKSGLRDDTIQAHRIMSVPPSMIGQLLGFDIAAIRSAMLIPFPDPRGGYMDHVRLKIFPSFQDRRGHTIKYLQPARCEARLYFPWSTLSALDGSAPLWLVEGEKKSLAVAQLGLLAVGLAGVEAWHRRGSLDLLPDFRAIRLQGRRVELLPDGDVTTNLNVRRGVERLAAALAIAGARPRLATLPEAA
jgi:Domain of unknown function (DUF3854)